MGNDDILLRFGADTAGAEAGAKRVKGAVFDVGTEIQQFQNRIESLAQRLLILFSIHQIVSFADRIGDAAERMDQLSQITSLSTKELREWDAIARANGKSVEDIAGAVGKLERAFVQAKAGADGQGAAFRSLGIDIDKVESAQEAVLTVADKFAGMEDGPRKYAAAVELMGRNGKEMIPILNMGSEALRRQREEAYELGAVFGRTAEEQSAFEIKGQAVDAAMDRWHLATLGISNALADALAPAIATTANAMANLVVKFLESYRSGGDAKTVLDALGVAFHAVASAAGIMGSIVYAVFQDVAAFGEWIGGYLIGILSYLKNSVIEVAEGFSALGRVIVAVLTGHADQVDKIMERFRHFDAQRRSYKNEMASFFFDQANDAAWDRLKKGSDAVVGAFGFALKGPQPATGTGARPQGGFDISGGDTGAQDAESQRLRDEDERNNRARLQSYLELLTARQSAARDDFAEQMRLEDDKLMSIGAVYGRDSDQYMKELAVKERMLEQHLAEVARMERAAIEARAAIARGNAQSAQRIAESGLEQERATIQQEFALGLINEKQKIERERQLNEQLFEMRRAHEDRVYLLTLKSLQDQLALEGLRPEDQARINQQIEALRAQHENNMAELSAQAGAAAAASSRDEAAAWLGPWVQAIDQVASGIASMFGHWATGMSSFAEAWQQFGQMLLGMFEQWMAKMIAGWIKKEAAEVAATVAGVGAKLAAEEGGAAASVAITLGTAVKNIAVSAVEAAAGAYKAIAGIPFVGPFLAPAVAAGALAAVMSFGSRMFSAAGGWDQVPFDGATTELHKDEMVLPSSIASPLRSAISAGQIGSQTQENPTGGGKGGDTYNLNLSAMDAKSFRQFARDNRSTFFEMIEESVRGGAAVVGGRPGG